MTTLAVCIAAWQTRADWLDACLTSIVRSAALVPDVAVTLRIGVDACPATAAQLDALSRAYAWSPVHVGAYVLRNSLLRLAEADAYAIFDADDVMLPAYMPTVTARLQTHALVGPSRTECDATLTPTRFRPYRHGVCAFRHAVLTRLGGYQAVPVAADTDFIARARQAGIHPYVTADPLYLRRRHPASLTKAPGTGFGSPLRAQIVRELSRQRLSGKVWCAPVTTALVARGWEARTA
jgi:hypothetical protein